MAAFTMFLSALGICLFKPLSKRFHKVLLNWVKFVITAKILRALMISCPLHQLFLKYIDGNIILTFFKIMQTLISIFFYFRSLFRFITEWQQWLSAWFLFLSLIMIFQTGHRPLKFGWKWQWLHYLEWFSSSSS